MNDELETEVRTPSPTRLSERQLVQRMVGRGLRFMSLGFWLLYALIGLQIMLEAMGAHDYAGFKKFLDGITGPFLDPFRGLLDDPALQDHQLMLSYVVVLAVYFLLQGVLRKLVLMVTEAVTGHRLVSSA